MRVTKWCQQLAALTTWGPTLPHVFHDILPRPHSPAWHVRERSAGRGHKAVRALGLRLPHRRDCTLPGRTDMTEGRQWGQVRLSKCEMPGAERDSVRKGNNQLEGHTPASGSFREPVCWLCLTSFRKSGERWLPSLTTSHLEAYWAFKLLTLFRNQPERIIKAVTPELCSQLQIKHLESHLLLTSSSWYPKQNSIQAFLPQSLLPLEIVEHSVNAGFLTCDSKNRTRIFILLYFVKSKISFLTDEETFKTFST